MWGKVTTVVKNVDQLTARKAAPELNTNKHTVNLACIKNLNVPSPCRDDTKTLQQRARNYVKINLHRTFSKIAAKNLTLNHFTLEHNLQYRMDKVYVI